MSSIDIDILFEDNHLLVVSKPTGIVTMGAAKGEPSLINTAKEYVQQKYQKPGNVYLGVVSRIDKQVSGVVVFARTSKAAKRLNDQFRTHKIEKIYWAIVSGKVRPTEDICEDWLLQRENDSRMRVVPANTEFAKKARLFYRQLSSIQGDTLLEIKLETGRKHQIRVQLAHRGHPLLNDSKYGSRESFPQGIALHAKRLVFQHPTLKSEVSIEASLPDAWKQFGVFDK